MALHLTRSSRIGLVRPAMDAHTLGLSSLEQLLKDCGFSVAVADPSICEAVGNLKVALSAARLELWVLQNRLTAIGYSYRLDPEKGAELFGELMRFLKMRRLLSATVGGIQAVYFAGLPETCSLVKRQNPDVAAVFVGDETPAETLYMLGVDRKDIPRFLTEQSAYDEDRLAFGRDLIRRGDYLSIKPADFGGYPTFGTRTDSLVDRVAHRMRNRLSPVMRAHVGPYLPDREEAVKLFLSWARELAQAGLLDVLSIGTSQLTQSNFGEEWGDKANGGGVPLNAPEEFAAVWRAARPMLVRTYAGTRDITRLARMYEDTINMAWHALSLWWFCRIDGRGPYSVRENLQQHFETIKYIASIGKPLEANVPHHFAFRGADDVTYIVSAVIAARVAKSLGIRHFILQNMLNTPKPTWGIQDLAKSRAMLQLVRELQDSSFRVILQPRGGLDSFSHDLEKAKAQLAAVTALMDDIEPRDPTSPPIIHVVSYSEATHLATPAIVNESIQITRHALCEYRRLREKGDADDMTRHAEVLSRTQELLREARCILQAIERMIPDAYTANGLYEMLAFGFLAVPYLWECKGEFRKAMNWQTRMVDGGVRVVDRDGRPVPARVRVAQVAAMNSHELLAQKDIV